MRSSDKSFPSVAQAALLLLASYLFQYLVSVLLYDCRSILGLGEEQVAVLALVLSNGLLVALLTQVLGISYRHLLHPSPSSPVLTLVLLVPPLLLTLPLLLRLDDVLISTLQQVLPLSNWEQQAFASMLAPTVPALVAGCLLAPLFEEMMFRGILLAGFLRRYPRGQAIAYSALFFGAAHLNLYQFFLAFLLGLMLGWLYERSRSLLPCIALHAAVNASAMASSAQAEPNLASGSWPLALAAGAAGALALYALLGRKHRKGPIAP